MRLLSARKHKQVCRCAMHRCARAHPRYLQAHVCVHTQARARTHTRTRAHSVSRTHRGRQPMSIQTGTHVHLCTNVCACMQVLGAGASEWALCGGGPGQGRHVRAGGYAVRVGHGERACPCARVCVGLWMCVCVRARPAANVLGATVCKLGTRGARACRACRACSHCCTNVIEQTSARTRAWALPVLDTHACARTRARMPFAGKCAHTNACMHARSHARTHTHMHRHTCTRMMHMRTTGHINLCTCRAWASLPVGSASTPSARVSS